MKRPVVDLRHCKMCMACVEICPEVFRCVDDSYIEVVDLEIYPEKLVGEAIDCCPCDCIYWDENESQRTSSSEL